MEAIEQLYPRVVVAGTAAAAGVTDPKKIREFEPRLVHWAGVTLRILEDNKLDSERTPVRLRRLAKKAEELDAELAELIDDMEAETLLWAEAQVHDLQGEGEPPPSDTFALGNYRVENVQDNVRNLVTWARGAIRVRSQVRIGPKNLRVHARKRAVRDLVPLFTELTGERPARRTTKDDHKQYGPLYDFVVAALVPIFGEEARTGVEHDIRAALRDPPGRR